ncbi:LOW QUALITY PROTEIN: efflux protein matE, partial [Micromonospora sp. ATCC 39149]
VRRRRAHRRRLAAPDRRADRAGPGGARRRTALRAGRHGGDRSPGPGAPGRARRSRHRADVDRLAGFRAGVRDHRAGRPPLRCRRPGRRGRRGGAGVLARARGGGAGRGRDAGRRGPAGRGARRPRGGRRGGSTVAAGRRAGCPRPAARRRRQRLAARRTGHPPAAVVRARPQPALRAALRPDGLSGSGGGLTGSAVANALAQTLSGALFAAALAGERVALRPRPRVIRQQLLLSRDLLIRGVAFQASFLSATAVAARFGAAAVGAHQIAVQLWFFTALMLDALAIAAQALVGAALGAGDAAGARALARRMALLGAVCGVAFAGLIAVGAGLVPGLFSSDPQVREQAMVAWPWLVALQPIGGVVFALDGVLIGAGDVRYLRNLTIVAAFGGFLPAIWLAYAFDLGLGGIWAGLTLFVLLRLAALLLRLRSGGWAVVGAVRG